MENLKNKVVVVTGGNSGIGYASAQLFAEDGAQVIISGRNPIAVENTARSLDVLGIVADQADLTHLDALTEQIRSRHGNIDVLFLNAGIGFFQDVATATEEHYDSIMNTNVKGTYFTVQKLLPLINEGGSIIINASANAVLGVALSSVYAASKAALLSLNKVLATELGPRRIRVNAVLPGPTLTPFHEKSGIPHEQQVYVNDLLASRAILKRFGTPEEVAKVVRFLASDEAAYITGAEVIVDGGLTVNALAYY